MILLVLLLIRNLDQELLVNIGEWTREQVYENLTNYKILVLPSFGEAHALVIPEAISAGLTVVLTNTTITNLNGRPNYTIVADNLHLIENIMKIAWNIIGTNKDIDYALNCAEKLKRYCLIPDCIVDCILYTDHHHSYIPNHIIQHIIPIQHLCWPLNTLLKYMYFNRQRTLLQDYDYLFYIDANAESIREFGHELLYESVACQHPGLWGRCANDLPFDRNPISNAYIRYESLYNKYYYNFLFGGRSNYFLKMSEILDQRIQEDLSKRHLAIWNDESYQQCYWMDNPPEKILTFGEFAWPKAWFGTPSQSTKITILEKDHEKIRN